MLKSRIIAAFLTVFLACGGLAAGARQQADEQVRLQAGDAAPAWHELPGTDGKKHSLADLQDQSVVVVCFTSNTCLYSVDYEDRLISLQNKYREAGLPVTLVAINANAVPADSLEKMQERAREKKFNFLYLRDEDQSVVKAWGAIFTPEFYVLNARRQIVYSGALDDSTQAEQVKVRYVELAVDAALQGKTPEVTSTPARGCQVRQKRIRRPVPEDRS